MTTSLRDAEAEAAAARAEAEQAELAIASGARAISLKKFHEITDRARYRELTADGERQKAMRERAAARLADLEELGREIDALATGAGPARMAAALAEIARACEHFRALAAEHDATVTGLAAAARQCGAEPAAPAGPRKSSAFVAVKGTAVMHRNTIVRPVAGQVLEALGRAMTGAADDAAAMLCGVERAPESKRPAHLIRTRGGQLIMLDEINEAMGSQIGSGEVELLSDRDIDRWMAGELG